MKLDLADGVSRAATYSHAVVSFLDADGYPTSVAGDFVADARRVTVEIGPIAPVTLPADGQEVCVIFSHIRPRPGIGYDERRYVNLWGAAEVAGSTLTLRPTLATGWDEAEVPFVEYAERNVPAGRTFMADQDYRPRLSRFWTVFLATRLPFLTATIVPIALGGVVAARDSTFSWGWFLVCLLAGVSVHLGLNIANDLADDTSGADAANLSPTPFSGGSRVIQYGLVSRRTMLAACAGFYAVTAVLGLWLAATRTWWLLVIGVVALILSFQYTSPPLRLVHRGLGEPVVALGFGPIMAVGTYVAITRHYSWEAFVVSLSAGLLCALILYVNQVPDRLGDAAVGKRTLIVRWSRERVITAYAGIVAAAFALLVVGVLTGLLPAWALLGLLSAPLAWKTYRGLRQHYDTPFALIPAMAANIGLHLSFGVLVVIGYLLDLATR